MALLYPQLASGATAQYPLQKSYRLISVTNLQEDGSLYASAASDAPQLNWLLKYEHITASEADSLQTFFESASGRLLPFTFLDPVGNLLVWSEDLTNAVWQKSSLLQYSESGNAGLKSFRLSGPTADGNVSLASVSQTLPCPATALICFGLRARSDNSSTLNLSITDSSGSVQSSFELGTAWQQYSVNQMGSGSTVGKSVAISVAGQIEVMQMSVLGQPAPGTYVATGAVAGLRKHTRFDQDSLLIRAMGKDDYACQVRLYSNLA